MKVWPGGKQLEEVDRFVWFRSLVADGGCGTTNKRVVEYNVWGPLKFHLNAKTCSSYFTNDVVCGWNLGCEKSWEKKIECALADIFESLIGMTWMGRVGSEEMYQVMLEWKEFASSVIQRVLRDGLDTCCEYSGSESVERWFGHMLPVEWFRECWEMVWTQGENHCAPFYSKGASERRETEIWLE